MFGLSFDWGTILVALVGYAVGAGVHIFIAYRTAQKHVVLGVERSRQSFLAEVREKVLPEERAKIVAAVKAELPTQDDLVSAIKAELPTDDRLNLLEERVGSKLETAMEAKWATLQSSLSDRVGQVVQANIASAKGVYAREMQKIEDQFGGEDMPIWAEGLGIFLDEDSVKKVARVAKMYKKFQANGGKLFGGQGPGNGQPGQPQQYPFGTVMNGYVATPQGWLPIEKPKPAIAAAPPPAVRAEAPADLPPELPAEPAKK